MLFALFPDLVQAQEKLELNVTLSQPAASDGFNKVQAQEKLELIVTRLRILWYRLKKNLS